MIKAHERQQHVPQRARRRSLAWKDALYGYLFVSPQVLGFLIFVLGPLIAVFVYSLEQRNLLSGEVNFIGLQNYQDVLFGNPLVRKVLVNSLIFTAGLVPLNLALALILALLLARSFRGVTFFRTLFFAPVVTSAVAWAIVWRFMLQGEQGTVNQFLSFFGVTGPTGCGNPLGL